MIQFKMHLLIWLDQKKIISQSDLLTLSLIGTEFEIAEHDNRFNTPDLMVQIENQ